MNPDDADLMRARHWMKIRQLIADSDSPESKVNLKKWIAHSAAMRERRDMFDLVKALHSNGWPLPRILEAWELILAPEEAE